MMAFGWMAFLSSWFVNVLFYKVHPSSVECSMKGVREKLFIHVQGKKRFLWGYRNPKGEKYFNNFIFYIMKTDHTEIVTEEKTCLPKLKSCLCCCRGADTTG